MSDPFASQSPTGEDHSVEPAEPLQFEQAEFETPAADRPACTVCQQPIPEEYYEINGKVMCPPCRQDVEAAFRGGSRLARFLKATAFGMAAAIVGAVIYHGSVWMTNLNIGLISVLVGFMVGSAVRKGSGNRGGGLYQLLAVFLTYSSIVAMHVPFLIEAIQQRPRPPAAEKAAAGRPDPAGAKDKGPAAPAKEDQPHKDGPKLAAAEGQGVDPAPGHGPPGADAKKAGQQNNKPAPGAALSGLALALAMMVGILYMIPIMVAKDAPISGLIYAFALWEAWKINKPIRLVFNGPFRLAQVGSEELKPEGVEDGV